MCNGVEAWIPVRCGAVVVDLSLSRRFAVVSAAFVFLRGAALSCFVPRKRDGRSDQTVLVLAGKHAHAFFGAKTAQQQKLDSETNKLELV